MTTSQEQLLTAICNSEPLPEFWLAYFREALLSDVHDGLLELFSEYLRSGCSKADLARKLGRRPEQVTRWLRNPGNLELSTVSDLALAMGAYPKIHFCGLAATHRANHFVETKAEPLIDDQANTAASWTRNPTQQLENAYDNA